jgi:hypothetical protein
MLYVSSVKDADAFGQRLTVSCAPSPERGFSGLRGRSAIDAAADDRIPSILLSFETTWVSSSLQKVLHDSITFYQAIVCKY